MNTLVVAHWTENLQWTAQVPTDWHLDVVTKGIHLPNRGREPSSFMWWIDTHYEKIRDGDLYGFVQGNPFGHVSDLWGQLVVPGVGFRPLSSNSPFSSNGNGSPHHAGVPVAECHERWFGAPCPTEVQFWPGGQFLIDGATLLRHPREFYRRIFDDLMEHDGLEPYAAERLWPAMFAEERWA
jgi:hypothetical protein